MNTNEMRQIIPVVERVSGWGSAMNHPIVVTKHRGDNSVSVFTLTKPELMDAGYVLTFTRVNGTDHLWVMSAGEGDARIIDTND